MNESTLVPSEEMGDLDWLARNVHVWPSVTPKIYPAGCKEFINGAVFHDEYMILDADIEITKDQWLARRAELQNKPSWDDFGESAKFMAQDSDGAWIAFESEPAANYHVWSSVRGWCGYAREGRDRCRGAILGDWRDTLEKRPEQTIADICREVTGENRHEEILEPFVSVEDVPQELGNLEWLAASIAEWPEIKDWNIKMDRGVSFFDDGVHIYNSDGSDYETISKRDWEIKVMELNKKPSIKTAKALAEAKLIEDKEPAGVYGVDHFYKPVCIEISEDAATAKQPVPKGSGNPILGMVLADLTNRALEGKEKYGEPLLAHNGRNALWDLYQELLDAAMYIRQAIEEQK